MKISVKITLMSAISIVALIVTVAQGYNGIHSVSEMFTYCGDVPITNNQAASDIIADLRHITTLNALYYCYKGNDAKIEEMNKEILDLTANIQKNLATMKKNASDTGMILINDFEKNLAISGTSRLKLNEFVAAGKWDDYLSYRIGEYENSVDATINAIVKYEQFAADVALKFCYVTSDEKADSVTTTLIVVAAAVVVFLIVLSIIIITGITKPLRRAVEAANHVAVGDLNVDLVTTSKDEIGTLMNALETMVESINSLITDTNSLSASIISGRLEVRADASKHKGAFRELILGIDKTVDAVIGPLNMTAEYIDRISKGDIPPNITDTYQGDFNEIKNNLNVCIDVIGSLVNEINNSIKEAINGNLKYRADADKFQGDYSKIIAGVNSLVETFVEPIRTTAKFLQEVAVGDENIQKITKDYKGEFNDIKQSVNTLHDILFIVLGEILGTAEEAQKGNLDKKADALKVKGAWNKIMHGLNDLTGAAGAIINDAGATLSIMATGDLTPRITKDYPGKFGEMKNNINNLGDSLTDLISQLAEAIHTTAAASAQISATAETIATATQEQSSQTEEVAGAVEEMSRTVTDNAHSATKTASLAKQSGEVANNGGSVVQQTVAKMREISSVVKTSAENISKLGESSKKIGEIISVIDDIADQTNLLSLNAAIEAARAGEQGRGFAVVADSVGKLAISTASATKEIADMIKGIQMDTDAAVRAMEKGTLEVQSGIELADNAGNSIKDILSGINELLNMINQIAAASDEQSATSEQISKNVSSISKVTAESARNIEDVASTANELAKMTDTLTSLVSQFKINDTRHSYSNSLSNKNSDKYLEE